MGKLAYKNAFIYFWSGTGNSYRLTQFLKTTAERNGINTRVQSVDICKPSQEIKTGNQNLLGIVFPTHGFTAPWHILKFIWHLPRGNWTHTFCVAARGCLKFGPWFIPGISGSATFVTAVILIFKGYNIRGLMSADMPSNWYSLHPIQNKKNNEAIINRAGYKVARFMTRLLTNNKVWFTLNNLYEITWGILFSLISIGYLFIGRFFLAKLFFANNNCNGCAICANKCPVNAIKMWGKRNPKPFWKYNCESCMRCAAVCPRNAVEAGHSWGIILYFVAAVPVSFYLFSWLDGYISGIENLNGSWIGSVLEYLYYYPAIFISYQIFQALLRIPVVNWLFTHTTMTHFPFWGRYHEPDTELKSIVMKDIKSR